MLDSFDVSPHFGGGSGLKHVFLTGRIVAQFVSPHFGGGSGLKLSRSRILRTRLLVSPHFGGGSGLKLYSLDFRSTEQEGLPSLRWGERIETWHISRPFPLTGGSPLTSVGGAD